jgi:adenine deaminase
VLAELALPIAGLMTARPLEEIRDALEGLTAAARQLGGSLPDPFMALAFLALPVIPALKLTDRGLVDVERFTPVDLFAGD